MIGLNPCCSGRGSSTEKSRDLVFDALKVLILVVVDEGLVHLINTVENLLSES